MQEPEIGNFFFGRNHPLKPHRVRLTHELLQAFSLERKLTTLPASRLTTSEMSKYHADEYAPLALVLWVHGRRSECLSFPPGATGSSKILPGRRYIEFLKKVDPSNCFDDELDEQLRRFNVGGHDCPVFDAMFQCAPAHADTSAHSNAARRSAVPQWLCLNSCALLLPVQNEPEQRTTGQLTEIPCAPNCVRRYIQIYSGGSIAAAVKLNRADCDVAINWAGGMHHARKAQAGGHCYVNDAVLAILELLRYHARVLYIDLDMFHGDGVEEAFYSSDRVMTMSFHKYG
jgi:hypothetical protein